MALQFASRWRAWRDRILSDPRFHRYASTSRWLAPVARRRAVDLFDICAGFVYSQILLACVRLDLFERLRAGPLSVEALASPSGMPVEAMRRLLDAAVPLDLVERRGPELYGLGTHGAVILATPGIAAMVLHHAALYRDLADPLALLRGERTPTELNGYWAYAAHQDSNRLNEGAIAAYTDLMSASQSLVADQVLASFSPSRNATLLDVGGGNGTFLTAVGRRWPHMKLQLFDLPAVAGRARDNLARQGLADRVEIHAGDFFTDPWPQGADVISFVRVLHDHDDAPAQSLLKHARAAIAPQGELLIAEPLAGTPGAERMGDAYFGFYLMAMGSGRPRRFGELRTMLQRAGFSRVRRLGNPLPLQTSVIVARV